jgi:hypothetical protein
MQLSQNPLVVNNFIVKSAVFSWWHLSGVLSEPCLPPPDPPGLSSPYLNQTKNLQPADQLTELRLATYLLPRLTTTSTSTHDTHPRESIVKFRSPGRVYIVRVSPWRATRRHLPVPCGYFGAGLVPNTFNPNAGFPKLVYLDPDIDERVVVYLPSWLNYWAPLKRLPLSMAGDIVLAGGGTSGVDDCSPLRRTNTT